MTDKTFNVSTNHDKKLELFDNIFTNMSEQAAGNSRTGIMLHGDPGTGKTSQVRELARLIGIKLITIEAPHITEEHIINIPFIVYDPKSGSESTQSQKAEVDENSYKIVLSDSHLFTALNSATAISDTELFKHIFADDNLKSIWESLGGSETKMPDDIKAVRSRTKVILFLDEYFRQTSVRIRNMLRNILNGKIGVHDLPKNVYVIYASNMSDEGLEAQASNADFLLSEVGTPSKEEWFSWLVNKFKKDQKVKLNMSIINKFHGILDDEDINHNDLVKELRISPRRWEQLLLYINSSLPCKDEKEAKSLLTNIRVNFKSFTTGEEATILNKVLAATVELIKETSSIDIDASAQNDSADWRSTLEHQIKQKMNLGNHRSYIPVVAGAPGIGKTTEMANIALDLKLRYIHIDCSTLDPEDVIGLPLAKGKEKITTHFSAPKLYKYILDECKKQDSEYIAYLKKEGTAKDIQEYEKQEYKYMVFFDELNRAGSVKVFNAIRQVLLEKKFGDEYKLPDGTIMVSALNPTDIGVNELTGHIKDVVDIIGTAPSWKLVKSYLNDKVKAEHLNNDASKNIALQVLYAFVDKFKVKTGITSDERPFHLNIGSDGVYISPREYTTLLSHSAGLLDRKLSRISNKDLSKATAEELIKIEKGLRETIYSAYHQTLASVLNKHGGMAAPEFMHDLKNWFLNSRDIEIGQDVFYTKVKVAGLNSILDQYLANPKLHLEEDADFVAYIEGTDLHTFKEDVQEFLSTQLEKDEDVLEKILTQKHAGRVLDDKGAVKEVKEKVSDLEHILIQILHSIKIHGLSNDRAEHLFEAIKTSIRAVLKRMDESGNQEHPPVILAFMNKLKKIILAK